MGDRKIVDYANQQKPDSNSTYLEGQNEYKSGFWPAFKMFAVSGLGLVLGEAARQAALIPEPKVILAAEFGLGAIALFSVFKMVKNTITH